MLASNRDMRRYSPHRSFHRGKYSRHQQGTADILHKLAVLLALGSDCNPFRVRYERTPALLTLGHAVPGKHIGKLQVALADQRRPKPGLTNTVLLPKSQRLVLEAREQRRKAAGNSVINAQFIDHRFFTGTQPPRLPATRSVFCSWRAFRPCGPASRDARIGKLLKTHSLWLLGGKDSSANRTTAPKVSTWVESTVRRIASRLRLASMPQWREYLLLRYPGAQPGRDQESGGPRASLICKWEGD